MTLDKTAIATSLSRDVPLFAGFDSAPLVELLSIFDEHSYSSGQTIFRAGSEPNQLRILIEGSLSVRDDDGEMFEIHPLAPIGELNAFTGEAHNFDVLASSRATLLSVSVATLESFLRSHGDLAYVLHRNLLRLAARKIGRDRHRAGEMRENIVGTQKAMKRMRDALLDSEDNPLHAALFEELDASIEQNRKVHYLVEPSRLVPTSLRLGAGETCRVLALSTEWVHFADPPASLKPEQELTFTLLLDGHELPAGGRVDAIDAKRAVVYLDELIPEYEARLNRHLARAQLLDVVL